MKFTLKNKNSIRAWVRATAEKEGFLIKELNYIFGSDKFLLNLNEQYLHHDYYTDVITFDLSAISANRAQNLQGDVYISISRVIENANFYKTTFENELHRVMIHGVLHLAGYKDKTKADKGIMRKKEDYYLSLRAF